MDLWGLIFGGIGAVTGLVALYYAHSAKRGGEQTTKLATDANDLAKGSNSIALDARRIAMEANEFSHRAEQRDTERHDVHWDGDWVEPGLYRLVKHGDDAAHNVKATVTYEGETVTHTAAVVSDNEDWIDFKFASAVADFRRQVEKRARPATPPPFGITALQSNWQSMDFHSITERVEWTTARGKPMLHAPDAYNLASFDEFL